MRPLSERNVRTHPKRTGNLKPGDTLKVRERHAGRYIQTDGEGLPAGLYELTAMRPYWKTRGRGNAGHRVRRYVLTLVADDDAVFMVDSAAVQEWMRAPARRSIGAA